MKNKIVQLIFIMLCCSTFYAQAQSGSCGTALTWSYADGVLSVVGEGEMSIEGTASYAIYKNNVKKIVIGEGVTTIEDKAFTDFALLENVTFPSTLLSIGIEAFKGCSALQTVNLPESLQKIGTQSFAFCDLHSLTVPRNVTEVGDGAFNNNSFLEVVCWNCNIPREKYREPSGSSQRGVFENSGVRKVVFGSEVTGVPDHLFYKTSLNELVTAGSIEYVGLNAFTATPWLQARATTPVYIDHCLYYWPKFYEPTKVDIPEGVKGVSPLVFADNAYLIEITLPKSLEYLGGAVFANCHSLTKVNCNAVDLSVVSYSYYSLNYHKVLGPSLAELIVGPDVKSLPERLCREQMGLKEVVLPNVEYIGDECFYDCRNLVKVQFDKVVGIGDAAFYNTPLRELSLPESLEYINFRAFNSCADQAKIVLGSNLKNIGLDIFDGMTIDTLVVNTSLPEMKEGEGRLAAQVNNMIIGDEVTMLPPSILWDGTISGGNYVCKTLTIGRSVHGSRSGGAIPADTVYWNAEAAEDKNNDYVRSCCKLVVGSNVKSLPSSFMYINGELEELILSEGLESIGEKVFNFAKIKNLVLPKSLKAIGNGTFNYCKNLESVVVGWEDPRLVDVSSDVFSELNPEAVLFVPKGTESLYTSIEPWKRFANIGSDPESWEKPQCAAPVVTYSEGRLHFSSETDGATFYYNIGDTDIKAGMAEQGSVQLSATYDISVYCTATGHINSEMTYATLCFLKANESTGIENIAAGTRGVVVSVTNGVVTVSGLDEGELVELYGIDGRLLATDYAADGVVRFNQTASDKAVVIVKINGRSIKVAL